MSPRGADLSGSGGCGFWLGGHHPVQPGRTGPARWRGHDLDRRTAFQGLRERHQLIAHARRDTVIADIAVHGVGKIERTGPFGQLKNVTAGRRRRTPRPGKGRS